MLAGHGTAVHVPTSLLVDERLEVWIQEVRGQVLDQVDTLDTGLVGTFLESSVSPGEVEWVH